MDIRSKRERVMQILAYELFALVIMTPLFHIFSTESGSDSLLLLFTLSIIAMVWTGFYAHFFDIIEYKYTRKPASARKKPMRVVHAVLLELGMCLLTLPVIKYMLDYTWMNALISDILISLAYMAYAYFFFWAYDKCRPMAPTVAAEVFT
jgi:uncharacterized membrane protein